MANAKSCPAPNPRDRMEKAKTEADTLKAGFKAQRVDFELKLEAVKAGAVDPEDAVRLCDRAQIAVSDDFASVNGAKEAVETLRKGKPYLFQKESQKGVPPPGTRPPSPRGVFNPETGDKPLNPQDRIARGLEKS